MKKISTLLTIAAIGGASTSSFGQILQGTATVSASNNMTITVTVNTNTNMVDMTLTGPSSSWFGYGFGGSTMNGRYTMISSGTGGFEERTLGNHTQGSSLTSSVSVNSNTTSGGVRTVTLSRSRVGSTGSYFTFPNTPGNVTMIWAKGTTSSLSQHLSNARGSAILVLSDICNLPTTVMPDVQICNGDSAMIFGNWESQAAVYSTTLTSSVGCDSVVEQELIVSNSITNALPDVTICNGESATIFGNVVSTPGVYYDSLTASSGCDSILSTELFVETITLNVVQNGISLDASATNAVSYDWIDCATGMSTGQTGSVFTATTNGEYAVVYSGVACSDTSTCYLVEVESVGENGISIGLITPNPFSDYLQIEELPNGCEIEIYNINGQLIHAEKTSVETMRISTTEWPSGVYIIHALDGSRTSETKVIKN